MTYFRFLSRKIVRSNITFKRNGYIVLLPQIPQDTPESNPLLRTNALPEFSQVTFQKYVTAVAKRLIELEVGVHHLEAKLSDPASPKTVQNVILPLDSLSNALDFTWSTFRLMHATGLHESSFRMYMSLHPRVMKAKQEQYLAPSIYQAFKELNSSADKLAEPARRLVQRHLLEARLSGMDLDSHKLECLHDAIKNIKRHTEEYRRRLKTCVNQFTQPLEFDDVKDFPKDFLSQIVVDNANPLNGPWEVTLIPQIYNRFMELCEHRLLRWNVWHAKQTLASSWSGQLLNNSISIEEIRHNRMEQANVLGHDTFAKMSMETKMAGSVENVMALITTLHTKSQVGLRQEIQNLQDFANKNGFEYKLELWDIPFWQRKHRHHLYGLDDAAVRQYFPLPKVLKGIFQFCQTMFGTTIVESTDDAVDKWHNDVTYYKMLDENGTQIASFFLDPYSRPDSKIQGARMEIGRSRSDVTGSEPLTYLIFNFSPPQPGKPSLLTFREVITVMEKFGHLLQHCLSTVPYNDITGINNLEWDVVEVCPLFMSSWLRHYGTLASLSGHVDTGEKVSAELHDKLIKDWDYMCILRLTDELFLSALDLEVYSRKDFWLDITKRLWSQYMPFPYEKRQSQLCSFSNIFCDEYPAAYFSSLWAKMIAADLFRAFEEVGLDDSEKVKELAQRFRETYLAVGGGQESNKVFRNFRGRDPSTDAMVRRYGLDSSLLKVLQ